MNNEPKSRICGHCCIAWPKTSTYAKCPCCRGDTVPDRDVPPDYDFGEAKNKREAYEGWHAHQEAERNAATLAIAELELQFDNEEIFERMTNEILADPTFTMPWPDA